MRHGVLGQKRRLQPDFGSNPLALGVRRIRGMIAAPAAPELWTEVGALNLVKLLDLAPGLIAHGAGNIDLQFQYRHEVTGTSINVILSEAKDLCTLPAALMLPAIP